jgi:hypothetical protein
MRLTTEIRTVFILSFMCSLLIVLAVSCGGGEAEREALAVEAPSVEKETVVERETVVEKEMVVETVAEEVAEAPAEETGESVGREPSAAGPVPDVQPQAGQRLIIKDANLDLEVANTDRAIDGVTQVAGDLQGYIISQRVWYEAEAKYASITMAVPVQDFENALRRLRGLGTRVLNESASGEDVTDQYVDLQSRLRNLEATRDRIRSFLDQATTVEEALEVNRQLSDIEDQIEQVQGRINYLRDRAAFSTITVNLNPIVPTPTPTATPTPTPTPTATPTATPEAWRPGETVREASDVLITIVQGLIELIIWFTIVIGPFIVALAVLLWVVLRLSARFSRRREATAPPAEKEHTAEDEA